MMTLQTTNNPEDEYIHANSVWYGWMTEKTLREQEGAFDKEQWEKEAKQAVFQSIKNPQQLQGYLEKQIERRARELADMRRVHTILVKSLNGEYEA